MWRVVWGSDVKYNNNVFFLSPSDIIAFQHRTNPGRFPYRTLDDVDVILSGSLKWLNTKGLTPQIDLKLHQFVRNPEKSYGVFSSQINKQVGKIGVFGLLFVWMPNYLIRYYRDLTVKSEERYAPCRFGEYLVGFNFVQRLGPFSISPGYRLEIDDYVAPFDYYDTKAHHLDGSIDWRPMPNFTLGAEYEFKRARAKAPSPDISYNQHRLSFQIVSRPKRLHRFGVKASYRWTHRRWTAIEDVTHAGRIDETQEIEFGGEYRMNPVTVSLSYKLEWRDVSSPYLEKIEDIKNYRAGTFIFGARLPLKIGTASRTQKGKKG
ncbi:MAG: hypothetical protein ACUVUD_02490 [bacterium]